jgi:hypothetical protein
VCVFSIKPYYEDICLMLLRDCHGRSKRVANVLGKFGIGRGEQDSFSE